MPSISEQKHLHIKVGSAAITITFFGWAIFAELCSTKKERKINQLGPIF
jgi:hypothetical protein